MKFLILALLSFNAFAEPISDLVLRDRKFSPLVQCLLDKAAAITAENGHEYLKYTGISMFFNGESQDPVAAINFKAKTNTDFTINITSTSPYGWHMRGFPETGDVGLYTAEADSIASLKQVGVFESTADLDIKECQ